MAATCKNTDIWAWINTLPPPSQWKANSMSTCICSSNSSLVTLSLSISKNIAANSVSFSILASFNNLSVSLWTSKPIHLFTSSSKILDDNTVYQLILIFVQGVLKYGPVKQAYQLKIPKIDSPSQLKDIFNVSFLTLVFIVCIYEAPADLRSNCLHVLKDHLKTTQPREASKQLMRILGSNAQEQWMRCLNLAVTNWKMELRATHRGDLLRGPSPLFSQAFSTAGLWKVQLFCPVITMEIENSSGSADEELMFSLNYHQLEGVILLNYKVIVQEKWIEVAVNIDNIRLDVIPLVKDSILNERGAGSSEKLFPSRISLQLTPTTQTCIISASVSKSSQNPETGKEYEKGIEASFEPPRTFGINFTANETTSTVIKPWKFEESVIGDSGTLSWFLHDSDDGKEVFSSKPSPMTLLQPKAWFKHRYSNVNRPFTRQGGVVFAGDAYGEKVYWKVEKSALGKTMEWEIAGCIGLTYWPNKYRTFYNETRRAEFRETLQLSLV